MNVVWDIETDKLHNPSVIHCIVCKDTDTNEITIFDYTSFDKVRGYFARVAISIGHNICGFDIPVLESFFPGVFREDVVHYDTLILSRLANQKLEGGHSLDSWGERLKHPKLQFNAFDKYTPEMLEYCINDVHLNHKVWLLLKKHIVDRPEFTNAIKLEHFIQGICNELHDNGFPFDITEAKKLHEELCIRRSKLEEEIREAFPPRTKFIGEVTPYLTKHGTISKTNMRWYDGDDYTCFTPGCSFSRFEWEVFNPGSPKQVIDRLNEAGWKPVDKTEGHKKNKDKSKEDKYNEYGWKINEKNLSTLPDTAPEGAHRLIEWIIINSRIRTLQEWFDAYRDTTGCIHGTFNGLGTWTHRFTHTSPNMGNVPSEKNLKYSSKYLGQIVVDYGRRMRALWGLHPDTHADCVLVGTDAEGIQLRVLAHYMNDPDFIEAVVNGKKDNGTDIHSMNKKKLGEVCDTRDSAKTFIYAWILGAAVPKIADIFKCAVNKAREARDNFVNGYPGLKKVKEEQVPFDAKRGYFQGFDGRLVKCDSEHHMLSGYLQNGEAVIMKLATYLWYTKLKAEGVWFRLVNFVHDEWQTMCKVKDAEYVAQVQRDAIREAGEMLKLNCPMAGSSDIGKNWYETH